jgi:hypothetical protein
MRQLPVLKDRPAYQLPFSHIQLDPPPGDWIPADLSARVQKRNQLPEKVSLLDHKLPSRLAAAFAEHPWIERVVSVRNQYPALVTVRVEYRQPAAVVHVKTGLYPVDGRGVLLPPGDFSATDVERLIPIHGIVTTPSIADGKIWNDAAVLAAADLAMYLGSRWQELQLSAIYVSPASAEARADDISLELETAGGSRILWGRMPSRHYPGELTGEQKLGRVQKYLGEFASFERPSGPYEIDIRHWEEISRRPLRLPISSGGRRDAVIRR